MVQMMAMCEWGGKVEDMKFGKEEGPLPFAVSGLVGHDTEESVRHVFIE